MSLRRARNALELLQALRDESDPMERGRISREATSQLFSKLSDDTLLEASRLFTHEGDLVKSKEWAQIRDLKKWTDRQLLDRLVLLTMEGMPWSAGGVGADHVRGSFWDPSSAQL